MNNISANGKMSTKTIAKIGVLAGVATILMLFDFPLWFAPNFYKLDFSEVPVMLGTFALGPVSGVLIELVKILINFVLNGTDTGGVGELSNMIVGCAFLIPAGLIYQRNKSVKSAIIGLLVGTLSLSVIGSMLNYYVLLPVYSKIYGAPIKVFIDMGKAINPSITDLKTFVLYAVVPFNLLKGTLISVIVLLVYKKLSPILHK